METLQGKPEDSIYLQNNDKENYVDDLIVLALTQECLLLYLFLKMQQNDSDNDIMSPSEQYLTKI